MMIILAFSQLHHAQAAGSESSSASATLSPYQQAKKLQGEKKFAESVVILEKLAKDSPSNPDVWNLLAFAKRNLNDNDAAALYYQTALQLNPNHKGALEYQGQLFIKLNNEASAVENYNKLRQLCPNGCEELADLKKAINQYLTKSGKATIQ